MWFLEEVFANPSLRRRRQSEKYHNFPRAVATKVAGWSDMITWLPERGGKGARVNPKQIRDSVESSLKRLGTDYIDLIQIHWPDRE
jgi:aryl-alcohol dehydrogenase-like predicted oxidoreductase